MSISLLSLLGIQNALAAVPSVTTTATTAVAPVAAGGVPHQAESFMPMIWMLVGFVVIFYFLLMRPQSKRAKEHRKLMDGLAKGDEVVTTAGVLGKIVKITDSFIVLNVAENVDISLQKNAIVSVVPKGTMKNI